MTKETNKKTTTKSETLSRSATLARSTTFQDPDSSLEFDYFYPKHTFSRDVSQLGFLEKISPKEFFLIEEHFQTAESFSLDLEQVKTYLFIFPIISQVYFCYFAGGIQLDERFSNR